jgi:prepilin-type processing-associated H-X9-DG protein
LTPEAACEANSAPNSATNNATLVIVIGFGQQRLHRENTMKSYRTVAVVMVLSCVVLGCQEAEAPQGEPAEQAPAQAIESDAALTDAAQPTEAEQAAPPSAALDTVQQEQDAARLRNQCQNNLKQLGIVFKMFGNESRGARYPQLSAEAGTLMYANVNAEGRAVYPEYVTDVKLFVCPADPEAMAILEGVTRETAVQLIDDQSYFFLGYLITNDEEMEAFAAAYKERLAEGSVFDTDLIVGEGKGTNGGDRLFVLREGIERFLITDINRASAATRAQSTVPLLIERPGNHPLPNGGQGGSVLYMDGHVEFLKFPGKWPMTEKTIQILEGLDAL